jgi:hypothetical protein
MSPIGEKRGPYRERSGRRRRYRGRPQRGRYHRLLRVCQPEKAAGHTYDRQSCQTHDDATPGNASLRWLKRLRRAVYSE